MEKKYSFVIIGILVAAFGIYAYNYPPTNGAIDANKAQFATMNGNNAESKPSTLRMSLIEEMVTNYRKTQLLSIENAAQNAVKEDAYSILFHLDTLKKFISDMERGVKENQPTPDSELAIRIYYAAYPSSSRWNMLGEQIPKLYERKHTLILIPVIKNDKGIFADFNPFDKSSYQGFPKRMTNGMQFLRDDSDTTEIQALNHGELIPPASSIGEGF